MARMPTLLSYYPWYPPYKSISRTDTMATTLEKIKALELELEAKAATLAKLKELHRKEEERAEVQEEAEGDLHLLQEKLAAVGLVLVWRIAEKGGVAAAAPPPPQVKKAKRSPSEWNLFLSRVSAALKAMEDLRFPAGHLFSFATVLKRAHGMDLEASFIQEEAAKWADKFLPAEEV